MNRGFTRVAVATLLFLLGLGGVAAQAQTPSRPDLRVLRSWHEELPTADGGTVVRRIDLVFDYTRGTAEQRIYDEQGQLIEAHPGALVPTPAKAEIEEALAIVQADPTFAALIELQQLYVDGGFILNEPAGRACGPHSRCLQIFGFRRDGRGVPLFRAVVDLTRESIVYRDSWDAGAVQ